MGPVLLCVDGSDDAREAIRAAGERLHGAAIVIAVWEPTSREGALQPVSQFVGSVSGVFKEMDEIATGLAREYAEEGAALAREGGFEATACVQRGRAWSSIVAVANEHDASTIVLGAHGVGAVGSLLMGSVSSAVVHHAHRPVLVVPPAASGVH